MLKLVKLLNSGIVAFLTEVISIATSKQRLKQLLRTPLYSNASYLMIAPAVSAFFGFFFWIIVSRLYSAEDVGLASAIIAAMGLLAAFSHFGLGMGLIRFLPHSGKNASLMVNTVFTIGTLVSVIVAFIFVAGLGSWSPAFLFIRGDPVYLGALILFTIASTLSILMEQTFVAERRAGFVLARSLIFSLLKLPLPILLATFFHAFGIFASWGISMWVALLVSFFLFMPRARLGYRPLPAFHWRLVNDIWHFSFANYISGLFWSAPIFILPIMVLNLLGAEPNAYFYIGWVIGSLLIMIPSAISTSLFAEGSYEEESLDINIWKSLKMVFLILVPAVILILAFADKLLLLFGCLYSENATMLLRILAISTLPLAVNVIYLGIKRVERKLAILMVVTAFLAVTTLALSYVLLPLMGINGAGIAWLASQGIAALVITAGFIKRQGALHRLGSTLLSKREH